MLTMPKRFRRLFFILLLIGVRFWWDQHSFDRMCTQVNRSIDLESLQTINRHNLQEMGQLELFADHVLADPIIKFNPTSQSMVISTIGSSTSTELPYHPVIWHFDNGCVQIPGDPTELKSFLEFSRNGEFFLLHECLVNNCYALYSSPDGRMIGSYYEAAFVTFPQGEMLAYRSSETDQRQLLNLSDKQVLSNDVSEPYRNALLFSPDYQFFVTANSEGIFTLWNAITGGQVREFTESPPNNPDCINLLQFSPNTHWLVSRHCAKHVEIWNIESGEIQLSLTQESVWQDKYAFLLGGQQFMHGHYIWNIETALPVADFGDSSFEALSPDNSFFITRNDKSVLFWDTLTLESFFSLDLAQIMWDVSQTIWDVSISPDQKLLAITTVRHIGFETIGWVQLWGIPQETE